MRGKIKTREKCANCGGKFHETMIRRGSKSVIQLQCPKCRTRPNSFYIFIYLDKETCPEIAKREHRISRNENGRIIHSYDEANRLLESINDDIDKGKFKPSNYIPKEIEQFRGRNLFPKWLNTKESTAPTTYREYKRYVKYYFSGEDEIIGYFHNYDMRKCIAGTIEDFLMWLPKHLAEKTKKNILIALHAFFAWLYRREDIDRIPIFPILSVPDPIIEVQDIEEREKAIFALRDCHKPIFTFLADHPVRTGEARALRVKHVDMKAQIVHISETFSLKEIRPRKSKKDYILPLSPRFNPSWLSGKLPDAFIFTNEYGRTYKPENLRRIWQRACMRAEVPYISPYNASRHTTATRILKESGGNLELVSRALGHSSKEMARKYAKWDVEILRGYIVGPNVQGMCSKKEGTTGDELIDE